MKHANAKTDYIFSGVKMHCLLTGKETGNSFCLFENHSPGHSGTPVHLHEFEDETIIVHEGEMTVVLQGVEHRLVPGEAMFLPRGVPHQLKNLSGTPSRYGILCSPSGFENFVAEAGHVMAEDEVATPPSPLEIQAMKAAAPRFGIRLLPGFPEQA